jgi:hypothetical protein
MNSLFYLVLAIAMPDGSTYQAVMGAFPDLQRCESATNYRPTLTRCYSSDEFAALPPKSPPKAEKE